MFRIVLCNVALLLVLSPAQCFGDNRIFNESDHYWYVDLGNRIVVASFKEGGNHGRLDLISGESVIAIYKKDNDNLTLVRKIDIVSGWAEEDPGNSQKLVRFAVQGNDDDTPKKKWIVVGNVRAGTPQKLRIRFHGRLRGNTDGNLAEAVSTLVEGDPCEDLPDDETLLTEMQLPEIKVPK